MEYSHLCMGCMADREGRDMCPRCGYVEGTRPEAPSHLPPRTVLSGRYLLGKVLGHGGFGITYLAWDMRLDAKLAIKEYLPHDFASRSAGGREVQAHSGTTGGKFAYGLQKFLEEARILVKFSNHPGIVSVLDFFKENGTAYLVMSYIEGVTLEAYLNKKGGRIPFEDALKIMTPVMDALREVHGAGLLHRDVSPDNIYITAGRQVKLLDFGAARYMAVEQSNSLTVILKPGYAPPEQYYSKGSQGPWTDVYAAAATLYRAITGKTPPESLERMNKDGIRTPAQCGAGMPRNAEAALMKALSVDENDRFQMMQEFQDAIAGTDEIGGEAKKRKADKGKRVVTAGILLLLTAIMLIAGKNLFSPLANVSSDSGSDGPATVESAAATGGTEPGSTIAGEDSPELYARGGVTKNETVKSTTAESSAGVSETGAAEKKNGGVPKKVEPTPTVKAEQTSPAADKAVSFPDKNLEALIRKEIGKPSGDIFESDVDKITYLNAGFGKITNIEGIGRLSNVNELWLNDNKISDISELKNLTELTSLALFNNKISDISSLRDLKKLERLVLSNNEISSTEPVKNLTNLTELWLQDNRISDINALSGLVNLTDLLLYGNRISDISALGNLTELTELSLFSNQINDISPLGNLTKLEKLYIYGNNISDISVLSKLIWLEELWIWDNPIADYSPLDNLKDTYIRK